MSHSATKVRRAVAVLALTVTAAVLAGCGAASSPSTGAAPNADRAAAAEGVSPDVNLDQCGKPARTVKHDLGTTTISGSPAKVVALEYSFVDALVAVGMSPVGVADDGQPERIIPALRDKVGEYKSVGLRATPNIQVITALKPDLIVADSGRHKAIYAQLSKIAPTIAFASLNGNYQQVLDSEMSTAIALDKCDEMKTRLTEHAKVMADLKAKAPADESRTALFVRASDKGFTGFPAKAYTPGVLEVIGIRSPLPDDSGEASVSLTLETLVATKPDVMFIAPNEGPTLRDTWAKSPLWREIPAVKNNTTFDVDPNEWSRSRGLIAAEVVAQEAVELLYGK
ncbi:Fe(3+)-dicitrate ABC transporter substrate-binding protein FecB [Kribbella turkmenica]|uniref:Fe(3+)-dicitrate ABC transporter substrate-binding protein FecB n=1 Tax=Kribbella turkmenica TaxID=2530375 RepID=A0A4R4XG90_9ACTN|nr:Fe(3+) dicitrate ABC transporter substrate-binding protein [Kribbella turkmenica]TDD29816.1 Fe(3+)-dicitrate ABC transporter substrate-binding protein FecB [Kribbella turkmenica]